MLESLSYVIYSTGNRSMALFYISIHEIKSLLYLIHLKEQGKVCVTTCQYCIVTLLVTDVCGHLQYFRVHHNTGGIRGNVVRVPDALGGRYVHNGGE